MKYHEVYHHKNETMLSVYLQGQDRTGHGLFLPLFQNLMRRSCLLLLLATAALGAVAQSKIAFNSYRDGNGEIYVMNPDGSSLTRLTNNAGDDRAPSFSPDGSRIVFSSDREGKYQIFVMNADGTGQTRLTNDPYDNYFDPVFSPDGKKIAFTSEVGAREGISIMNADGTGQTTLVYRAGANSSDFNPSFSPDGSKIVFVSNRDGGFEIYVINTDGSSPTRLTNNGDPDSGPSFSPDGSKIVFFSNRDAGFEIYVMNADGTNQTRLTYTGSNRDPSFSPDGSKIVFFGNLEIYVMNADGTGQTNLTNNTAWDQAPSWGIVPLDSDGDGVLDVRDCAPTDKTKWRTGTFYTDADGDTYTVGSGTTLCYGADMPTGYSATKSATDDCDDNNAALNPATVWYKDADNDGYSDGTTVTRCARPTDYKLASELNYATEDCDDNNAILNPATVWYKDADNDGYSDGTTATQCIRPANYKLASELTALTGDCNDGDALLNPATFWYKDADNDSYSDGTTTTQCTRPTGYKLAGELIAITGDCKDDDGSVHAPQIYYLDFDRDGYGNPAKTISVCSSTPPANYVTNNKDCNDNDAAISPVAVEVCGNRVDDNCDGVVDEKTCYPCQNATNLNTSNITSNSAQLNWSATANPQQWQLQYKTTSNGSKWIDVFLTGNIRSVKITSLLAKQNYNWHLRAKCNGKWTNYSSTLSFTTAVASFVNIAKKQAITTKQSNEENLAVKLYPNPTRGQFVVELHLADKVNTTAKIELVNMMGQTVSTNNASINNGTLYKNVSISSSLAGGMYIAKITVNNKTYLARVVYQK